MKIKIASLFFAMALTGCSTVPSQPTELFKGTVHSVHRYQVEEYDPSVGGGLVGAGVGGLLGNQIGKGSGRTAMTVLGSVLGAGVGSAAAGGIKTTNMAELEIVLDKGEAYNIKFVDKGWYAGQRVVLHIRGKQFKIEPM